VKTLLKSVHIYQSYCKKNLAQFFWPTQYMIAHMGWIGLGQNFRKKKYGFDWIGSEIDWIGLGWIKKLDPCPTLLASSE